MSIARELLLVMACTAGLGVSEGAMADEAAPVPTAPVVTTFVRIDKAHPVIVRSTEYPRESLRFGEKGVCAVRVEVDYDGLIRAKQLVVSSGFQRLDAACLAAFAQARFIPATVNGQPVANWINLPLAWGANVHANTVFDEQLSLPIVRKDYQLKVGPRFYPADSLAMRQEGDCSMHVVVNPDGTTGEVQISQSTGYAALDQACESAIKEAVFDPGRKDGVAVRSWADVNLIWRLPVS